MFPWQYFRTLHLILNLPEASTFSKGEYKGEYKVLSPSYILSPIYP